jgi:large subunit ribosomal protein L21
MATETKETKKKTAKKTTKPAPKKAAKKTASKTAKTTKKAAPKKTAKKSAPKANSGKFAVIATGGKQYVVFEGDTLKIEKIAPSNIKAGKITFDQVLLVDDGKETKIGTPTVSGSQVVAEVIEESEKQKKVTIQKFKSKSNYSKKNGHRQIKTIIKISEIK